MRFFVLLMPYYVLQCAATLCVSSLPDFNDADLRPPVHCRGSFRYLQEGAGEGGWIMTFKVITAIEYGLKLDFLVQRYVHEFLTNPMLSFANWHKNYEWGKRHSVQYINLPSVTHNKQSTQPMTRACLSSCSMMWPGSWHTCIYFDAESKTSYLNLLAAGIHLLQVLVQTFWEMQRCTEDSCLWRQAWLWGCDE